MELVEQGAATSKVVASEFAFDAARVESTSAAHAAPSGDLIEYGRPPLIESLRGEWPQLAAVSV